MVIKIEKSKTGNQKVSITIRLNEVSGHIDLINMVKSLGQDRWTKTKIGRTALQLLYDEWTKNPVHPLSPSAEFVSAEMLELVKKAHEALDRTNEILKLVTSGALNQTDVQSLQNEIGEIKNNLDFNLVEGSGGYAGKVALNEIDDNDFGDW